MAGRARHQARASCRRCRACSRRSACSARALEHHYSRSLRTLLRAADLAALNAAFDDLERQARAQLAAEGVPAARSRSSGGPPCTTTARSSSSRSPSPTDRSTCGRVAGSGGGLRARARAHLRPSRGRRRAGRARHAAGDRERGRRRAARLPDADACARQDGARAAGRARRLLRARARLARHAGAAPRRPSPTADGAVHRRGVRRDLPGAARRARVARPLRQHPHRSRGGFRSAPR